MADTDLTEITATESVKIIGANSTGTETNPVNADANGSLQVGITDPSNNKVTSQANGTQRALDVGVNVAGVQIDPRTIGVSQTTAPSTKTTGTVTQITTDEYARAVIVNQEAINAEWGQMFSASTNQQVLTGTTETAFLYFQNPNASGKSAKLFYFSIEPTLGNNYVTYRFYKDPTVTANGTIVTVVGNRDTNQNATVVNVFFAPTVTANGTLFRTEIDSGLSGNGIEVPFNFSRWVEANHSILITRQLSANATIGGVNMIWAEQ